MNASPASPISDVVIHVPERRQTCVVKDCGGIVARHSLGTGQAVDRCTRCFRRYRLSVPPEGTAPAKGRLQRLLDEFVAWRE
jgi:hypothetical protein